MTPEQISILLSWAYRYLSYRARTEQEMRGYLTKKTATYGFPEERVEDVITLLKEQSYLNDYSFIEEFVAARTNSKPKGEYVIRQELLRKGISSKLLDEYFSSHVLPLEEMARRALEKKWYRFSSSDSLSRKKKAYDFLRRRGFSHDVIQKTIEEIEASEYN